MLRARLFSCAFVLSVCLPLAPTTVAASVKPPLECKGVDKAFGDAVLTPAQLMCLSIQAVPDGGSDNPHEGSADRLAGRRFSILFQPDTYNTSEDSQWSYDETQGVMEIDVRGNLLSPEPAAKTGGAAEWWKLANGAHGLHIRTDYLPPSTRTQLILYLAELGAAHDPARLGDSPFYARFHVTPDEAAQLRQNTLLQAEGEIVAPKQASALHCGSLAKYSRGPTWYGATQDCIYSVRFTYFAFRLAGSGRVLAQWRRP